MKKFVLFLFVLLLMFSLTACCCLEFPSNDDEFTTGVIESEYIVVEPSTDETESNYDIAEPSTDETESKQQDTVESSTSQTESTNEGPYVPMTNAIDYSALCGTYYDSIPVSANGPCYSVTINKIDNNTKSIEFSINYIGYNLSPIYETGTIYATIASDNTVQFVWSDSWGNKGTGTLVLNLNNTSTIQILVTVTEDSGANRATLSTNGNYKTLTRG